MVAGRSDARSSTPPLLLCLTPVRNAEADLPGFLEAAACCCDGILALDDGSTDATYDILAASPLVWKILRNPRREDYRGWDDAANRNRLLEAAATYSPEWIISLDADERLDEVDAASLREFLQTDALPGCAYGFRHVPMRGDTEHFWPKYQWVYRLFSYEPGQRFPNQKLHFIPVPTSIPRQRWIKTTLRIQHLGGMTPERRLARFRKYLEADPRRTYQAHYGHLLQPPPEDEVRPWQPRPRSMPVLMGERPAEAAEAPAPALSAIIIARNDEATIARSVASVVNQDVPEPFEVIVVTSGTDRTAEIVRQQFPGVIHVDLDRPALPGEARNAGLRVASGEFVSFPGSHVELLPGSLSARLRAHRRGYAMVTGITENGNTSRAGWASYFLDHHEGLPGHGPGELNGPPAHCSYARLPLLEVGGFPEGVRTAEDTAVNRALVRRGYVAYRDPAIRLIHRSPCMSFPQLIRHHFQRGLGWGRLVVAQYRERGGLLNRELLAARGPSHLLRRLRRIEHNVARADPSLRPHYEDARPYMLCGAIAAWAGMWAEILRPAPGKLEILLDRPTRTVLIGIAGPSPTAILAQVNHIDRSTTMRTVPTDLAVHLADDRAPALARVMEEAATGHPMAPLGRALAAALDIDRLDVLAGPPEVMRHLLPNGQRPDGGVPGLVVAWLRAIRAARRGSLGTTLSPWSLLRVLAAVRTSTSDQEPADRPS